MGRRKAFALLLVHVLILVSSDGGILLVLVLGDEIDDVLVGLLELHLVHALALVPVEERLSLVESRELRRKALEHGLERGGVGHEGGADARVDRADVDDAGLDVVGDPLNELLALGALDLLDVLVGLLGGDVATVDEGGGEELAILDGYVGEELLAAPDLLGQLLDEQLGVALVLG